ncbi:unnamed protein product, partial [Schistosoma intercalatum]
VVGFIALFQNLKAMENNNRQLDKIAKRRAADTKYPRLFGCSRSTYYRRLRKIKFRDHFMGRLYHLLCDDLRKSAKACLKYLLSPELANTYTLHGTRRKFGISKYKFYSTVQSALCSHFRSATCFETEITHAMATASQAFLHDARDKVHKRGWRSKERLASQALSDVTNIINDSLRLRKVLLLQRNEKLYK